MNYIADDMRKFLGAANDILAHIGIGHDDNPPGRGSGRYAWGSGKTSYQHLDQAWLDKYVELKKSGMKEKDMAKELGALGLDRQPSPKELRAMHTAAVNKVKGETATKAKKMFDDGKTYTEIAKELGIPVNIAKAYVVGNYKRQFDMYERLADSIADIISERGIIDIGKGTNELLGLPPEQLATALYILESEGYPRATYDLHQAGNKDRIMPITVIGPPGTEYKDLVNPANFNSIEDYTIKTDGETLKKGFIYPESLDSSRLRIRYAEDGGNEKDGVLEIRRGMQDFNLGLNNYSQIRILVDGTHYIKGMAVYADDLPEGVDAIFNTNKSKDIPMMGPDSKNSVLKPISTEDPNNPFGSSIKDFDKGGQSTWTDELGVEHLNVVNKRADAGDWDDWSKATPSQFLAKQPQALIENQLNLSIAEKRSELDDILQIPNPTLRKQMLYDFAGTCDTASYKLNAASFPNQSYQVLLPVPSLPENQVFAPNYKEGTQVALIRFPHAGMYEIPILTVNNSNEEAKRVIGLDAPDAIGINHKTASILSGADFDGDTAIVIPITDKVHIKNLTVNDIPELKALREFDPHKEYAATPGCKLITTDEQTGKEMGIISNLITDMQVQFAPMEDLILATKHSMVIIDAKKHGLDYKRSEKENHIAELKAKYQVHEDGTIGGAATLLSRAKNEVRVPKREGGPTIDENGNLVYRTSKDAFYKDASGKEKIRTTKINQMLKAEDAFDLVSPTRSPVEIAYAIYANSLKDLAREARLIYDKTPNLVKNNEAYKVYRGEVDDLMAQVKVLSINAFRERKAQAVANAETRAHMKEWDEKHPDASRTQRSKEKTKFETTSIKRARDTYNAHRRTIKMTDRQWEAFNSGAIGVENQKKILKYVDRDDLVKRSLPRNQTTLSPAKQALIRAMATGYTNAEIAERLGVSKSTVVKYLKGGN